MNTHAIIVMRPAFLHANANANANAANGRGFKSQPHRVVGLPALYTPQCCILVAQAALFPSLCCVLMPVQAAADWLIECPDLERAQHQWQQQCEEEQRAAEEELQKQDKIKKQVLAR